ncbi:MAG: hypothetical protein ACMXYF_01425 [Candidatus Woesearchaeota archaeon]
MTGASGTGKTSLVSELKNKFDSKDWEFLHFDSVGIPSTEDMIKKSGSIENWQKETTFLWIEKMLTEYKDRKIIIFEGQVNLEFIKLGFSESNFSNYKIILIDCNEDVMAKRLSENRKQPELVNENMKNWLCFLRRQAKKVNAAVIETSNKSKSEVLLSFENILKKHQVI